jgi:hypothetical protein
MKVDSRGSLHLQYAIKFSCTVAKTAVLRIVAGPYQAVR